MTDHASQNNHPDPAINDQTVESIKDPVKLTKKFPIIPALISTIVVLVGVSGFFAYQYFLPKRALSERSSLPSATLSPSAPTPSTSPTQNPQIDKGPTSDWLSHTDDQLELTFKYPPTWDFHYLDEYAPSIMVAPADIVDKIKNAPGGFGGGSFLTIIFSLHEYDPSPSTDELSSIVSKSATIDSKEFTHYTSTYLQDGPGFEAGEVMEDYIIQVGNKYLKIGLFDSTQKETLDTIVSLISFSK